MTLIADLFSNVKLGRVEPLGVPYMGGKRKYASELLDVMLEYSYQRNGSYPEVFYDLFGGGGSMSFAALQKGMRVVYNEKHCGMANFMRFLFSRMRQRGRFGMFPDTYYDFVGRDEFMALREVDSDYAQFVRICYSFGNNQRDYFSNRDLEYWKRLLHNVVVHCCERSLRDFCDKSGMAFDISNLPNLQDRRLAVIKQVKAQKGIELERPERLQQLERLERLEQLEQLERLSGNITILNGDYRDVTVIGNAIVYLDPPYRGTQKYLEGIDHTELDNYFAALPYLAFMSEYNALFKCIWRKETRSTLSATNNKKAVERLYVNRV